MFTTNIFRISNKSWIFKLSLITEAYTPLTFLLTKDLTYFYQAL